MSGPDGALGGGADDDRDGAEDVVGEVDVVDLAAGVLDAAVELGADEDDDRDGAEDFGGLEDVVDGAVRELLTEGEVMDGTLELGATEVVDIVLILAEVVGTRGVLEMVGGTAVGDVVAPEVDFVDGDGMVWGVTVAGASDVVVCVLAGRELDRGGRGFDLAKCRLGSEPRTSVGPGTRPWAPSSPESTPNPPSTLAGNQDRSSPSLHSKGDQCSPCRRSSGATAAVLVPSPVSGSLGSIGVRYVSAIGVASV